MELDLKTIYKQTKKQNDIIKLNQTGFVTILFEMANKFIRSVKNIFNTIPQKKQIQVLKDLLKSNTKIEKKYENKDKTEKESKQMIETKINECQLQILIRFLILTLEETENIDLIEELEIFFLSISRFFKEGLVQYFIQVILPLFPEIPKSTKTLCKHLEIKIPKYYKLKNNETEENSNKKKEKQNHSTVFEIIEIDDQKIANFSNFDSSLVTNLKKNKAKIEKENNPPPIKSIDPTKLSHFSVGLSNTRQLFQTQPVSKKKLAQKRTIEQAQLDKTTNPAKKRKI